ncbi:MAG: hypothetical protein ABIO44_10345 [Saprospiraceae bacterium]
MSISNNRFLLFVSFLFILTVCFISCDQSGLNNSSYLTSLNSDKTNLQDEHFYNFGVKCKALMSSRFKNLEQLKTILTIEYDRDYLKLDSSECQNSMVTLSYISNGEKIIRALTSGVKQNELLLLPKANLYTQSRFVLSYPNHVRQRRELELIYLLSRRMGEIFGSGDKAFYDIAEASSHHINMPNLAYQNAQDSSEKGYLNTFNHVTAQAIMTSFFSEDLADIIVDLHEINSMPELTNGRFSESQLIDLNNNPVDNYIDIINNEVGQKIGLRLKEKFKLNEKSICTPVLLATYLNDIQSYYIWALEIGMNNFRPTDELIIRFSNKLNKLLKEL